MTHSVLAGSLIAPVVTSDRPGEPAQARWRAVWLLVALTIVGADVVVGAWLLGGSLWIAALGLLAGLTMVLFGSLWGRRTG